MYYKIEDFKKDWDYESKATVKVLSSITDSSLNQKVYSEGRTLARLAWHLVESLLSISSHAGLIKEAQKQAGIPAEAKKIVEDYEKTSGIILDALSKNWKDESLTEEIPMYGQMWKKGNVLSSLILHQAHHRGQITVLLRQAGLKVPGVYGPSKEEWAYMNMPALD